MNEVQSLVNNNNMNNQKKKFNNPIFNQMNMSQMFNQIIRCLTK